MSITVNGAVAATGKPGSYAVISRTWKDGDTVAFTLPMDFKLTKYEGAEQFDQERYALEYGPILMAVVGPMDEQKGAQLALATQEIVKHLKPKAGQPLHFAIEGSPCEYIPYWQVTDQIFTCFPFVANPAARPVATVGSDDLALASRGATVTVDSELDREKGCASKAIDGIIAAPGDFEGNRWHSALTPHPHWIEVKLPKPEKISRVVIRFADPSGFPVSFQGLVHAQGTNQVVFDETANENWRDYHVDIKPVVTDTFRFVIRASANTPASSPAAMGVNPNGAQISEIELY
jgi:hypothetical protein